MKHSFFVIASLLLAQAIFGDCASKCNLQNIFRTPNEEDNLNQFEILERSNFEENQDNVPLSSSSDDSRHRSSANAQIMLKFGEGGPTEGAKGMVQHHHNFFYPPTSQHPHSCVPNHFCSPSNWMPPFPFFLPNFYYYPGFWSSMLQQKPMFCPCPPPSFPPQMILPQEESRKDEQVLVSEIPMDIPITSNEPLMDQLEEKQITHIENKDHPRILQPLDLTNEPIESSTLPAPNSVLTEESNKTSNLENIEPEPVEVKEDLTTKPSTSTEAPKKQTQTEKSLTKALVPVNCYKCDQKRKLLVSYPIFNTMDMVRPTMNLPPVMGPVPSVQNCPFCQRDESIAFGKRFPVDIDDLNMMHGSPVSQANLLRSIIPDLIQNLLAKPPSVQFPRQPPSNNIMSLVNPPKISYNGYEMSSGSSSYSDPSGTFMYKAPSVMSMVRGDNRHEDLTKLVVPSQCYQVIPKYDIIPRYNQVQPSARSIFEQVFLRSLPPITNPNYCSSCAKYTGELNQ